MAELAVGAKTETHSTSPGEWLAALTHRPWLLGLALVLATVALYYPVHGHPFVNYDDRDYVYENPQVQSGLTPATIHWAFTAYASGNWHPLTWLSHALDCQLFGLNPAGHHDMNVLFHALNAVLLFWVLLRATGFPGRSFMVAALFALHPINVESVAWVAERKNLLSMMFFLLALGAYRWYVMRPRAGRYAVVAGLYAMGLMAKPQIITFPFILLLWDYWPLERYSLFAIRHSPDEASSAISGEQRMANSERRTLPFLLFEKLPLLVIAACSALMTLRAQHNAMNWFPRSYRLGNAILSYGLYLKKAFWPTDLALLYPHPGVTLSWAMVALSASVLLAITIWVIVSRQHGYLPVGWFWFLGMMVPMLGIVQVGVQAMANRYAYMSFVGLFLMICWGAAEFAQSRKWQPALLPAASVIALVLLAVTARHEIDYWQNDETLWTHTLQITKRNWVAESQLGSALAMSGRVPEGMTHFYNALAINPDDTNSTMGIAIYDLGQGNFREAVIYYQKTLRDVNARPNFRQHAYIGLAKAYHALGETAKAQECLEEARKIQ